jgi:GcrA cell cycle regulator
MESSKKRAPCPRNRQAANDDDIERLRTLWDEDLSASKIGRRLGVTKNTVMGKAWRLGLPRRKPAETIQQRAEITLPARTECFWPLGEPGDAGFHFCGQPAVACKPYCEPYCRRAYVRLPKSLEHDYL